MTLKKVFFESLGIYYMLWYVISKKCMLLVFNLTILVVCYFQYKYQNGSGHPALILLKNFSRGKSVLKRCHFRNSQPIFNVKVSKYSSTQMIKIVFYKVGCSLTLSGRYGRKTSRKKVFSNGFSNLTRIGSDLQPTL